MSIRTVLILALLVAGPAQAADISLPGIDITLGQTQGQNDQVATALKILLGMTVLSLAPAILMVMTAFTRIIIVLSILRHALGMQQTPPNTVLISLALFLTTFTMFPVFDAINTQALQPYLAGRMNTQSALHEAMAPMRNFMIHQTREQDLLLMVELSGDNHPENMDEVGNLSLIPAFMLSELRTAFEIGFVIFLPFLLVDIVVASILMSMGMMMVPPMMISLPIKILMFVLIDGWTLIVNSLMRSFT